MPRPLRRLPAALIAWSLVVPAGLFTTSAISTADPTPGASTDQRPMVMRYDRPAAENQWEGWSLPIGNGAMGANVFGGVGTDVLTLNEKTLWSGGPGVAGYRNGNYRDAEVARRHERLTAVREQINRNATMDPDQVMSHTNLGQPKLGYGSFETFGKLRFTTPGTDGYTNYERSLDLDKARATTTYHVAGVKHTREYIASHPDNVIAMRFSADRPGSVSFTTTYDPAASGDELLATAAVTANDGRIVLAGTATNNKLRYNAQVRVVPVGGTMTARNGSLTVADADSVVLVWAGGTDYANSYPTYRSGVDPATRVAGYVDAAADRSWDALVWRHEKDYTPQFSALKLNLAGAEITDTTDVARAKYRGTTAADRSLEELYFHFGRYLLISSSRPGSLPANLQGVWSGGNRPPWGADYHTNINLQMNYWPAWSTNLGETHRSYLDYIAGLVAPGRASARNVVGADGWMVMNETTPYGYTGVFDWPTAAWFPEANAWLAQAFWWEYLYSGDEEFLRTRAYPILAETAKFWTSYLQHDPRDNTLVANPSYSPEHGPFTSGAAMSQQIATELFTTTLAAADQLHIDDDFTATVRATLAKTDNGLRVRDGKIAEWKPETITGEPGHRHTSQLYALFPGRAISDATPDLMAAARGTLLDRGDGGTGWSRAWKVNFWAHLGDGDHAHKLLVGLLQSSTLPNLWDSHPPFQIDGNFGATSGIAEMLVQNKPDSTAVLPALPSGWANGSVDGIRAWGDTTIGVTWEHGNPTQIRYTTGKGGERSVSGPIAGGSVTVTTAAGDLVDSVTSGQKVTFTTQPGVTYLLAPTVSLEIASAPTSMDHNTQADLVVRTAKTAVPAKLALELPAGWQADRRAAWAPDGGGTTTFRLRAPASGDSGTVVVRLTSTTIDMSRSVSIALTDPVLMPPAPPQRPPDTGSSGTPASLAR